MDKMTAPANHVEFESNPDGTWLDHVVYNIYCKDPIVSLPKGIIEQCLRHMRSKKT